MSTFLSDSFEKEHDVIRADRKSKDVRGDITSHASIDNMHKAIGKIKCFDLHSRTNLRRAWKNLIEETFLVAVEGKMMRQINLVLIGQHYVKPKGSFTLITGALTHEPKKNVANTSAANAAE